MIEKGESGYNPIPIVEILAVMEKFRRQAFGEQCPKISYDECLRKLPNEWFGIFPTECDIAQTPIAGMLIGYSPDLGELGREIDRIKEEYPEVRGVTPLLMCCPVDPEGRKIVVAPLL